MKIIQSCGSGSWGGLEMIALETSVLLSKRGHEVTFITKAGSMLEAEAKNKNLHVLPVYSNDSKIFGSIRKLNNLLKHNKIDVVHTHLSHDLWAIVPALKYSGSGAKLYLTKHMGSFVNKKDLFHRYIYNRVDHIFTISSYVENSILKTCPVKKEKVSILNPGVSLQEFDKSKFNQTGIKRKLNIPENVFIIGMVGRISPGKGHEEILRAVKILKGKKAPEFLLLIAGGASENEKEYEKKIMNLAEGLGVNNLAKFLGFRKDIAGLMAIMDMLAFPSHEESFGVTLIEAMAMELAIVASNNAGIPDIVINGESGLLIPPKDPESLANAIWGLMSNQELKVKFGVEGRRRAEKYFNVEKNISKLEEYYLAKTSEV